MICPKCKEQERKSTISMGLMRSTAMYCPSFYDEEGKFHAHDLNSRSTSYVCSNGHNIIVINGNKCPSCDFGREDITEVVNET